MRVGRRAGGVRVRLEAVECRLLSDLAGQVLDLVADPPVAGEDPLAGLLGIRDREPPADPVLARLLPDSHHDDPELSAELRRLGEGDLRRAKAEAATRLVDDAGPGLQSGLDVVLDDAGAWLWLRGLTDVRLALGTRLELTGDLTDDDLAVPGPRRDALMVYGWLGELQERIVLAVDR